MVQRPAFPTGLTTRSQRWPQALGGFAFDAPGVSHDLCLSGEAVHARQQHRGFASRYLGIVSRAADGHYSAPYERKGYQPRGSRPGNRSHRDGRANIAGRRDARASAPARVPRRIRRAIRSIYTLTYLTFPPDPSSGASTGKEQRRSADHPRSWEVCDGLHTVA